MNTVQCLILGLSGLTIAGCKGGFHVSENLSGTISNSSSSSSSSSGTLPGGSSSTTSAAAAMPGTTTSGAFTLAPGQDRVSGDLTLRMQFDGNLVLYQGAKTALWSSGTGGAVNCSDGKCLAAFQSDGNLVLSHGSVIYWNSATAGKGQALILSDTYPYLQILLPGSQVWTSCAETVVNQPTLDASPVISECIMRAPAGALIAFPPGRYNLKTPVSLLSGVPAWLTLTTVGIAPETISAGCLSGLPGAPSACAIFAADKSFGENDMLFSMAYLNTFSMVAIGFDGNKNARMTSDVVNYQPGPARGNVSIAICTNCNFIGVASVNTLANTSFGLQFSAHTNVIYSFFADNGVGQSASGIANDTGWKYQSDGLTAANNQNLTVRGCLFRDNTDVQLIMGGNPGGRVESNTFAANYNTSAAAIMIDNWNQVGLSDYTDLWLDHNTIDCGPSSLCGIGIMVGGGIWYSPAAFVRGGTIQENSISNVKQGIEVSGASGWNINLNSFSGVVGGFCTSDGAAKTSLVDINAQLSESINFTNNTPLFNPTSGPLQGMLGNIDLNAHGGPQYLAAMSPCH